MPRRETPRSMFTFRILPAGNRPHRGREAGWLRPVNTPQSISAKRIANIFTSNIQGILLL